MNVDTSSQAVTASNSASSSVKTSSAQASSDAKTDNDFSKELEKASSDNAKTETNAKNSTENKNENLSSKETADKEDKVSDDITKGADINKNIDVKNEYLQGMIDISSEVAGVNNFQNFNNLSTSDILAQNIQALVNTKGEITAQSLKSSIQPSIDYSTVNMSDEDATFFADLVQNTDMTMQTIASQIQNDIENKVEGIEQKVKVSAVLINTIKEGMQTNKPFRIDFDKDVSVILRIDRDGSISANFIPGDKAVEQYLKNNIGFLKQRFDDENLSYKDLSYSQSRNQNRERNNQERQNDKEKD